MLRNREIHAVKRGSEVFSKGVLQKRLGTRLECESASHCLV